MDFRRLNARSGATHAAKHTAWGGYRESVVLGKLRKQRQSAIQYALGLRPIVHGPHSREPQERRCAVWRRALFSLKHQRIEVGGHGKF